MKRSAKSSSATTEHLLRLLRHSNRSGVCSFAPEWRMHQIRREIWRGLVRRVRRAGRASRCILVPARHSTHTNHYAP
jgi:hypothetical protein